ncbi:MAG: Omp28-related outer membrane protein [Bacteroidales bacterium]|jgi:hypothetical protein|nr:Omp28-related outer membrane protein [Bacteroidales bacterium]
MKKIILSSLLLIGILVLSTRCDKIEKPYKVTSNNPLDTPAFPVLGNVIQKYLLEDFTGHKCVNCPQAHAIADEMKTDMGDTLIILAIHSGNYARPQTPPYNADYRTEMGDMITADFNILNYPSGMISRKTFSGDTISSVLSRFNWKLRMASILRQAPNLALQILTSSPSEDSINVFVKTTFLANTNKNLRLYVVLSESGIISAQTNNSSAIGPTPDIFDYEHKHMLRTSIAPKEGNIIATLGTPHQANDTLIKGYTLYLIGKPWKLENCSVIAFISDNDTKEILQVEEVEL